MFSCKVIIELPKAFKNSAFRKSINIIIKITLILLSALLITGGLFFSLRNTILQDLIKTKLDGYLSSHPGVIASVGPSHFVGLGGIVIKQVQMCTQNQSLKLSLGSCTIQLGLKDLLLRRLHPRHIELTDLDITLRQPLGNGTFSVITKQNQKTQKSQVHTKRYAKEADELINLFFHRIPDSLKMTNMNFTVEIGSIIQKYTIPSLAIDGPVFAAPIRVENSDQQQSWLIKGTVDKKNKQFFVRFLPAPSSEHVFLPFTDRYWGLHLAFNTASIALKCETFQNDILTLMGSLSLSDLHLNHPRIAARTVNIEKVHLDYTLRIGNDFLELKHPTSITFNQLTFEPYLRFKTKPEKELSFRIKHKTVNASALFNSLPSGLFTRLAGLRVSGQLDYHLDFSINFSHPDELILESKLEEKDFVIDQFGTVDFRSVNEPFQHEIFENDLLIKSIWVGPENPDFRTLDQISPQLRNAVLICEDGAFFQHHGFLLEPFKNAIATNLHQERFVRGGSTISMQLVKNLYLKRHKTIVRKLEEMIITWLIEEKQLVKKERMYEIYLNIIEWGPQVYGITEAARYYFNKDPGELTLAESIFMASIVPRPKRFMVAFDELQKLKEWMLPFYKDVSTKMLQREMISQSDFDTLIPEVHLTGPARLRLKGKPETYEEETLN